MQLTASQKKEQVYSLSSRLYTKSAKGKKALNMRGVVSLLLVDLLSPPLHALSAFSSSPEPRSKVWFLTSVSSRPHVLDLPTTATVLSVIRIHILALPRGYRGTVGQKAAQPFGVGSFDTGSGAGADFGGGEVQTVSGVHVGFGKV